MKYLAAVDLSDASLLALDALRALVEDEGGDVTLLHVVDLDLYTAGGSVPGIMEFAKERLGQEADRLAGCGLSTPAIRIELGDSAQTIVRVAAEEQADLIVMTNLGKGVRTGRLFGSTAERVASAGTTPVLVERVGIDEGNGGECCRLTQESSLSRLLIAIDLDDDPDALLDATLGIPGIGTTRVVHVVRTDADVTSALERLSSLVSTSSVATSGQPVVRIGDPADEIVKEASVWRATAIALGPCAHGVVHRAVWGSVARAVALGAACSILFVASEA